MKLTKKSEFSGIEHTIELPIGENIYELGIFYHNNGLHIQDAFPQLDDDQREFILTGITNEEWEEMCGDEDGDNNGFFAY